MVRQFLVYTTAITLLMVSWLNPEFSLVAASESKEEEEDEQDDLEAKGDMDEAKGEIDARLDQETHQQAVRLSEAVEMKEAVKWVYRVGSSKIYHTGKDHPAIERAGNKIQEMMETEAEELGLRPCKCVIK